MSLTWDQYCRWAHESGKRKAGPETPEHERAALMKIWGIGFGEEMLEFAAEVQDWTRPLAARVPVLLELGDALFYMARMYRDSGNERRPTVWTFDGSYASMARHGSKLAGCVKKAFRSEGDKGLVRICLPEEETHYATEEGVFKGRRAEFGKLLDMALGAIETWLVAHGSSLSEVCELNVEKLVKRRSEGLISAQGERVSELGRAVRPEDITYVRGGVNCKIPVVCQTCGQAGCEGHVTFESKKSAEIPAPKRSG